MATADEPGEACACDHCRRAVRTALFDYLTCKTIAAFEGWKEDEPGD